MMIDERLLMQVNEIAQGAGDVIMEVYDRPGDLSVDSKTDDSPLTEADLAAHKLICASLMELTPHIPVLSEESEIPTMAVRSQWGRYWLVDPLDGTKEFVGRNGEFTVNIALIENHCPVLGVVYVPVSKVSYLGAKGVCAYKIEQRAEKQSIRVRTMADRVGPTIVVASRRHGAEKLDRVLSIIQDKFGPCELANMGSSLKICLVAEGKADIYPRIALTSEWDTGAAQAVLEAAGGIVLDPQGIALRYNTKDSLLNPFFYAAGDVSAGWAKLIPAIEQAIAED